MANKTGLNLNTNVAGIKKLKQYLYKGIGLSETVTISQS
jgi:hypothetical protein